MRIALIVQCTFTAASNVPNFVSSLKYSLCLHFEILIISLKVKIDPCHTGSADQRN